MSLSFLQVDLLIVKRPNRPEELGIFVKKLGDANIKIESIYLLGEPDGKGEVALSVSDTAEAKQILGF